MQQQARRIVHRQQERDRSSHSLAMGTCTCGEAVTRRVSPEPRVSHIMQSRQSMHRELVKGATARQAMRSLSLATRRGQGGSLATRGMLFSTYCIRWPVHNNVSFDTMSCIVQSQQYLPVVGLLRQVDREGSCI